MRASFKSLAAASVLLALLQPVLASQASFPDVAGTHPYSVAIQLAATRGIVRGNPDGLFYPERKLNRAEFLTMLYRASNRTPLQMASRCFPDVLLGNWYEPVVCDAAANRFVQGFNDGKFRPEANVTRAQALKMLFLVFGKPVPEITESSRLVVKFVDVSLSAWYTKYLVAAFEQGVLPIPTQEGPRFYPDADMLRGEAVAYIVNGLGIAIGGPEEGERATAKSSASSQDTTLNAPSSASTSASAPPARSRSSVASSAVTFISKDVVFPFSDKGQFDAKKSVSYLFTLTAPKTVMAVNGSTKGSQISCRLYLLDKDGFSDEYYLAQQEGGSCRLLVALRPGSYQLQIQPTTANVAYTIEAKAATGDGNDGFLEAIAMSRNAAKTGVLEPGDIQDFYKFTVQKDTTAVFSVSPSTLTCIINLPKNYDQYGFKGPECGTPYDYQGGYTYVVGIGRKAGIYDRQTYSAVWR